ncbi:unnamed protein product [Absidia cylindrospora]
MPHYLLENLLTLLVMGSHFKDAVEAWWTTHEVTALTWDTFRVLFKAKYCDAKDEMSYWEEIQNVKQGPGVGIEEVSSKLRHLFTLVNVSKPSLMIRTFIMAINSDMAHAVEKEGNLERFDDVVLRAVTVDKVNRRYGFGDGATVSTKYYSTINNTSAPGDSYQKLLEQVKVLPEEVATLKLANDTSKHSKPIVIFTVVMCRIQSCM